jgi:succinoglycan biosynthesis protein ExoU
VTAATANVCVIIAAKDAQATVGRAVASALADPLAAEVVVVDDGSTDDTRAAASRADDRSGRLTVLWLGRNVGPAAARNLAIAATRAPFITVLDSDDYWLPGRLGRLMALMDRHDFLADDLLRVKEGHEQEPPATLMGPHAILPRTLTLAEFALANVSRMGRDRQELGFLKPIMRRAFLERTGLSYDPALRLGEDFVLYAQALARGASFRLAPACGYVAVERPTSLSGRHRTEDLAALADACAKIISEPGLGASDRRALKIHLRHLRAKLHHRRVLDTRRTGGMAQALRCLASEPANLAHVVKSTLSDKFRLLQQQRSV